jgi:hypothetical protein
LARYPDCDHLDRLPFDHGRKISQAISGYEDIACIVSGNVTDQSQSHPRCKQALEVVQARRGLLMDLLHR